ncbi:hypothetical protein G3A39_39070 [Paraburkholderia aspalathi]|nr:hypothetical protein [Paraburkholderia aspalathi]
MKDWADWTDDKGNAHRYVSGLKGSKTFYRLNEIAPEVLTAVSSAYPIPSTLDAVLLEYQEWDRLYITRSLFSD